MTESIHQLAAQTTLPSKATPRYLGFLTLCYTMVIVLSNWFDPRLIHIFGLNTDAGTLIFPLTFLLSDLITEVYGYKHARRAIWAGFLFNALFILYGQLVVHLPSPNYPTNNVQFDALLAMNVRIIFASTFSYIISEPLNAYWLASLKIKTNGRFMGLRFVASTLLASGVDSVIFGTVAFYGMMSNHNLVMLILTMWLIKVGIEIIGLPFSTKAAKVLKQAESLDTYDRNTNFTLLSLDATYGDKDSHYHPH